MKNNNKQDIILFEELASNAHVALNIMQYDGWILKFNLTGSQMLRCSHGQDLRVRIMEADIT